MKLGVNIDHIAVLREARRINDPDPLQALGICARAGADQITIHLREDRRHIHDDDAEAIIRHSPLPVNLECAQAPDIVDFVCRHRPHRATLVPEKRQEVTTEGGLDLKRDPAALEAVIGRMREAQVEVSLFIDPDPYAVEAARKLGAQWVELHTGRYANLWAMLHSNLPRTRHRIESLDLPRDKLRRMLDEEYARLASLAREAGESGLRVAAGHGLNYQNVAPIVQIPEIEELNIGQSIVARSVFVGLETAVREMKELLG
ncbi:pyridoxine 5'-phosphate synthase [Nitratifractor sp.]